jgi:hypothetical protein
MSCCNNCFSFCEILPPCSVSNLLFKFPENYLWPSESVFTGYAQVTSSDGRIDNYDFIFDNETKELTVIEPIYFRQSRGYSFSFFIVIGQPLTQIKLGDYSCFKGVSTARRVDESENYEVDLSQIELLPSQIIVLE